MATTAMPASVSPTWPLGFSVSWYCSSCGSSKEAPTRYGTGAASKSMHPATIDNVGGSQAHDNIMPSLALSFYIAVQGLFPSRN